MMTTDLELQRAAASALIMRANGEVLMSMKFSYGLVGWDRPTMIEAIQELEAERLDLAGLRQRVHDLTVALGELNE